MKSAPLTVTRASVAPPKAAPASVLVVVTRRMGDVLLVTPLLRSLKAAWPQAGIDVLVFAGGKVRYGIQGSRLGVHRFVTTAAVRDPVADTQRVAGIVLGYMTKMGVSSTIVEAMSQTRDIRWLDTREVTPTWRTPPTGPFLPKIPTKYTSRRTDRSTAQVKACSSR